jgi:hypothetical protein
MDGTAVIKEDEKEINLECIWLFGNDSGEPNVEARCTLKVYYKNIILYIFIFKYFYI